MGEHSIHINYLLLFIVVISFTHFLPWRIISRFRKHSNHNSNLSETNNRKSNIKNFLNPFDKFALEKRVCQERRAETMELSMRLLHMKYENVPENMISKVKKMDQAKLDVFITKIVESKKIDEIKEFC